MIVFVSVSTRQAFFIIHPLAAFSFYTSSTCISLFLLSSHCEHFIPPKKMYRYYKVTKNLINVQRLCGRHLRQKLAPCFLGMTVHVCHSLLYIYMFQIGIICISTDCRHLELALEMIKCWLFRWPPMATYIFKLSSLSFSSTEKQYCSTMMIDYWKVAVISDCLQHTLAISSKYQAVDGDILTCKKKIIMKKKRTNMISNCF